MLKDAESIKLRNNLGFIDSENPLPVAIMEPLESNGAIPVNIQDQHSLAIDLNFIQSQGATTLSLDISAEDNTITLTDATGFVDGNVIAIFSSAGIFYFGQQVGVAAGNVITLDTPVDQDFSSGDNVIRASRNMNVDGSGTTQIFQVGPVGSGTGIEIDITRILGYIQDNVAMSDDKFGGIAALTNGIVFRHNNTTINNLWNAKTNGELALLCFDFTYTDKSPANSYGARFRNSYAGQEKHGVTIRLAQGDILEILIQDDLTGLEVFNAMAQGHIVTD